MRALEGWCLLGGKGRALPVGGEGLRAGEALRVEAAPCPLVGGTCSAERGGRAWWPLGPLTRNFIEPTLGLILRGQFPRSASSRSWATLTGFLSCCSSPLSLPPPPDAFSLPLLARYRHFQRRLPLLGAVEGASRDFGSFPSGVLEEGEFFPLLDGIFLVCRNGLSLISSYLFGI